MADAFRRFSVVRKHREAEGITSFHLVPADGAALWPARPGQYLTLRLPVPGGPVLRTYSISSDVADGTHYRISVKREAAPGVPAGVGSCWLHDQVVEGDVVEVAAPRGSFVLDEAGARPVLLLAGGIGVTPLLSMLHRLAQSGRRVVFVQACENGAVHALRDEVAALAAASGGRIVARSVYRQPSPQDRGRCDAEGLVDRAFLQSLLPLDHYEVYLCGPTPFMVAMWRVLTGLGLRAEDIRYEFFGKQTSLPRLAAEGPASGWHVPTRAPAAIAGLAFLTNPAARGVEEDLPGTPAAPPKSDDRPRVVFARSGREAAWTGGTLLELAEAAGLEPEFSCRSGICNTCRTGLREGRVSYVEQPLTQPGPGKVLLCCSQPEGRVVLDL
ncbi:MAG: 2Fe-2S iron-sulfur cluster-binding protein [Alphaproteobacteria bacterium]